jgi:hypothetical protein
MFVLLGSLLFAFSDEQTFDAFSAGLAFMGLGGSGIHIANFHISNLFPAVKRSIIASYSATFAASAIFFPLLRVLYEKASMERKAVLLLWSGLLVAMILVNFAVMPDRPFPLGAKVKLGFGTFYKTGSLLVITPAAETKPAGKKTASKKEARPMKSIQGLPLKAQLCTAQCIGLTVWFACGLFTLQFYLVRL